MKLYSKISAFTAMVVLTSAFASAESVTLGSWGNSNPGVGNTAVVYTGYSAAIGNNVKTAGAPQGTFNIGTGGVWGGPTGASSWVSFDPKSGPGGESIFDANGTYTYTSTFILNGTTGFSGTLTLMADDTTNLWLNGTELMLDGIIGSDAKCSDEGPNCVRPITITLSGLKHGVNTLTFNVSQTGSYSQGLDFSGVVFSTSTDVAPEPSTLLLFGTGLIGSAGALFRRMRA